MYKLLNDDQGNLVGIIRTTDLTSIPIPESENVCSRGYKDYLEWLSQGNTPLPAD
jgi:hypothetical protein